MPHLHPIAELAKHGRPREKILHGNPGDLSDKELVSILVGPGNARSTAEELAVDVLAATHDSIVELGKASAHDLLRIKGIGRTKAARLLAAVELGRRRQTRASVIHLVIRDSHDTDRYIRPKIADLRQEVFGVMFLAQSGALLYDEIVSRGGITCTVVDPRIIMKKTLEANAVSIIVYHNHPSGSVRPSKADEALTEKIKQAGIFLDIKLLDHVIIGRDGYFSFADQGMLA